MDSAVLATMLGIFLLSAVKLLLAPGAGIAAGLSLGQTMLITSTGGCCGVLFFYFTGYWLTEHLRRFFEGRRKSSNRMGKRVFTRRNRFFVKIKYEYGMIGLALLTPALISIPIGSVVAARFFWGSKWMIPLLLLSTILWSIGLTFLSIGIKQNMIGW